MNNRHALKAGAAKKGSIPRKALSMVLLAMLLLGCAPRTVNTPDPVSMPNTPKSAYISSLQRYETDRRRLVEHHQTNALSSLDRELTPNEQLVAGYLQREVQKLYWPRRTTKHFPTAKPFYLAKHEITTSAVYRLIREMPKGALLHTHLNAAGRMDWIMDQALTLPNCYVQWPTNHSNVLRGTLFVGDAAPSHFTPISLQRSSAGFSNELRKALTIESEDADANSAWDPFGDIFGKIGPFVYNRGIFKDYLIDAFQTLFDDKVFAVELRDSLGLLTDTDLTEHDSRLRDIRSARDAIRARNHTTNFHVRVIAAGMRWDAESNILTRLQQVVVLRTKFPELIAGVDLVGGEDDSDKGHTLSRVRALIPALQALATNADPRQPFTAKILINLGIPIDTPIEKELDFYLHEGESLWADNENLIDAILLSTPRIGHAFNLYRFPSLYPLIKKKGIALEICPISNQLLRLTPDLRAHPAIGYINAGIPCTLSSDDPAIFGNDGLSYDFWMATVAWNLDLAAIKQLARNSIVYSSLDKETKEALLCFWNEQWNQFVDQSVQCLKLQPES